MSSRSVWFKAVIVGLLMTLLLAPCLYAKTELRVGMWGTAERVANYQKMFQAFEEQNPEIKIKLEYAPWGQYWQKLQTQLAAGMAPDVVRMSAAYLSLFAKKGLLSGLDTYVAMNDFPIDDPNVFVPDLGVLNYDGIRYAIPEGGDVVAVHYNKDIFKAAGVEYPPEEWTWNDMLMVAKKITRDEDGNGVPDIWGVHSTWDFQNMLYNFLVQNGTQLLNEDKTQCLLDTPEAIEAVQFLVDLIHKHQVAPPPGQEPPGVGDVFLSNKIGMVYKILPQQVALYGTAGFDWDVAPMPAQKRFASESNWVGWGMSSSSKSKELAWKLLEFLAEEGSWMIADNRDMIPPLREAMESHRFADPNRRPQNMGRVLDRTLPYCYDLQFTPRWGEWTTEAQNALEMAFIGRVSAEKACHDAAEVVNKILKEEQDAGLR